MNKELWYFLISGQADNNTGLFGNFYAYGGHMGEALQNAFMAALMYNFHQPSLVEADLMESFEAIGEPAELIQIADEVHLRIPIFSFPYNDPDRSFEAPTGIVKAAGEDTYDYELIRECFITYEKDAEGIYELELVAGKTRLEETFVALIKSMPSIDGFWVYLDNDWEHNLTELWTAKHLTSKESVIAFLQKQKKNTLENGFVKLVVHSSKGDTNLKLNDHKKIRLHTEDEGVFRSFILQLRSMGYEQNTEEYYNLEFGFHHWHYRPAGSLTRSGFIKMLEAEQFEWIDEWEE
ncbi:MAG: hypothetical protein K0S33_2853 [Bacteroidetes bacterium]|jgi:hypothetical protein|nr:hypothetical protein [Bacteroidota bacterium]